MTLSDGNHRFVTVLSLQAVLPLSNTSSGKANPESPVRMSPSSVGITGLLAPFEPPAHRRENRLLAGSDTGALSAAGEILHQRQSRSRDGLGVRLHPEADDDDRLFVTVGLQALSVTGRASRLRHYTQRLDHLPHSDGRDEAELAIHEFGVEPELAQRLGLVALGQVDPHQGPVSALP